MKKALLLSLALLAGTQIACAQSLGYTPPAQAAFVGTGTPTTWNAWTSASGTGALAYTPPAIGLYCQASPPSGPWTPCVPGSGSSFSLTTTGTSGAATLTGGVLNIPVYSGGVPAFSAITSGTNTGQGLVVGAGSVLTTSSGGFINANEANGAAFPVSSGFAGTNSSGQVVSSTGGSLPSGTTYTNLTPASTAFFGIISAGDSRFAGQNSNITPAQNFIAQLNTQPQFSGRTEFAINGAVAGSTCATMTTNYTTHVYPYRPSAQGGVQVFQYISDGINDINTSVTFSTWSSCFYTYLQTITGDGFTPVISTIYLDNAFGPGGNGSGDLLRFQWNKYIQSLQGQVINGQPIHVFDADAAVGVSTNLVYGTSVYNSPQANYAITGYSVASGVGTFTTSAANPPAASTTATFSSGSASIVVASAAGIVLGQYITATGIPAGDYVASITGTTIGIATIGTTAPGTAVPITFNSPVLLSGFPSTSACLNASETATVTYVSATQFTMPVSCPNTPSPSTDTGLAQAMYFDGLHLNPQAVATILAPAANRDFALYNSGTPVTAVPPDRTDFINPVSGTLYVNGNILATGTVSPPNLTAPLPLQSTTSGANQSFIKATSGTAKLDISGSAGTEFVEFQTGSFWQVGTCNGADFTICNGTSVLHPFDISTTAPSNSLWVLGSGVAQSIGGFQTLSASATSSVNQNSPPLTLTGAYWNSSTQPNVTSITSTLGTGANPPVTLAISNSGSSGAFSVAVAGGVSGTSLTDTSLGSSTNGLCTTTGGLLTNTGCLPRNAGTATLVAGTVTVSTAAACAAGSTCGYKLTNCGGGSAVIGTLSLGTVTAGTSFVINSLTALAAVSADTSLVCWQIN